MQALNIMNVTTENYENEVEMELGNVREIIKKKYHLKEEDIKEIIR